MIAALILAAGLAAAPETLPEGFVHLDEIAPEILQDMRYAGAHNFTAAPVDGYDAARCILTREAAAALAEVQAAVAAQGYRLMVWDCYRPVRAVARFVAWSKDDDTSAKAEFYPRLPKTVLFEFGYIATRSRHSAGSTVDLTLVPATLEAAPAFAAGAPYTDCAAPVGARFADGGIDMGTGYDCFDVKAHGANAEVGAAAIANRTILGDAMAAAGFRPYAEEWWHFTLAGAPFEGEAFDFPVR